jgi:hypothetical protein
MNYFLTAFSMIINLLSFLVHLAAHLSSYGRTPPTLSYLFRPFLFGLGPATLPFYYTYLKYLHVTNAMEHVLLTFVCWLLARHAQQGVIQFVW